MSEQIQSLLNEMEDKFQKSFSQINLDEPLNKDLNPQSALKFQQKHANFKILTDLDDDDLTEIKHLDIQHEHVQYEQQATIKKNQIHFNQKDQFVDNCSTQIKENKRKKLFDTQFKTQIQQQDQNVDEVKANDQAIISQVQNPFYYQQLTMKLQKALQKISSQKSMTKMKKSPSFYDRIQQFQTKKKRQIERKKQQLQEKQINSVKDRPLINSHSRAIVSQISNDPIYVRCDRIIQKKKQKEQEYQKIKQERQKKQYEKYKQQFDAYINEVKQKYEGKTIRSPEEYYNEMMTWAKHKERNIQSKTTQLNEKLLTQNTFKPLINSKSEKILTKNKQKRVPIYEREPKQKEQVSDPNCTFKPKINKNSFYKKMSYYQTPF